MSLVHLTRVVPFAAAHRYFRAEWSAERNREVFGACAGEHGHGHSYECHVTVVGPMDRDTGMVMDLRELDAILSEEIAARFDHRFINHEVPEFGPDGLVPTGEALAVTIWGFLAKRLPDGVRLARVRVQEEPHLFAEYRGEETPG